MRNHIIVNGVKIKNVSRKDTPQIEISNLEDNNLIYLSLETLPTTDVGEFTKVFFIDVFEDGYHPKDNDDYDPYEQESADDLDHALDIMKWNWVDELVIDSIRDFMNKVIEMGQKEAKKMNDDTASFVSLEYLKDYDGHTDT